MTRLARRNKSRRLNRLKKHRKLREQQEYEDSLCWLCNCGNWIEDGLHCQCCNAQPPWGCPCSWCDGEDRDYDDLDYDDMDQFDYEDYDQERPECEECGGTGWVQITECLAMECFEC